MAVLTSNALAAGEVVVDFENATVFLAEKKANRVPSYEEKGVIFTPAHDPKQTRGKALLMFFQNLSNGHKGIASAMATESMPVRATFPGPVSAVEVKFWGSTGVPVRLEAFDTSGKIVDQASLGAAPARKAPGDPAPVVTLKVSGPRIAYVQFSGPREGEYLAADEIRFAPASESATK
jgi:hypothetical protein